MYIIYTYILSIALKNICINSQKVSKFIEFNYHLDYCNGLDVSPKIRMLKLKSFTKPN